MSDRHGPGFDEIELSALQAVVFPGETTTAVGAFGSASVFAHMLWRRRNGGLSSLPSVNTLSQRTL